jgi:cation:H+ antiporter
MVAFVLGAVISLATSWVLVTRLERVGGRLGFTEGLLGVVAALAADAPEITASVTALVHHQRSVSTGVVLGSNVFNLAALLGLGALVAGGIVLHRRVVILGGVVALVVAAVCLLSVAGVLPVAAGLAVVAVVLVPYVALLAAPRTVPGRLGLPARWRSWLTEAVVEEGVEVAPALDRHRATGRDIGVALGALVVVVGASIAMERGAVSIGTHFSLSEIVVGALLLAVVTSLPNAVAAVYLARRGRGSAALSTALNSNALNAAFGLLLPAALVGLAAPGAPDLLVAWWYLGLTALVLLLAYLGRGLGRAAGWAIIGGYALFVVALLAVA